MKKIILTGFMPFGNYKWNPTQDLAEFYDGKIIDETKIVGLVLPATYQAFDILEKLIREEKPDAIISTGLSSICKGVRIETAYRNMMQSKYADANKYKPKGIPIATMGNNRPFWGPNADYLFLAEQLYKENIPVEISGDAGTFICNALAYSTARRIYNDGVTAKNLFIHIPWTDDYKEAVKLKRGKIFIQKEQVHTAIELIVKTILWEQTY